MYRFFGEQDAYGLFNYLAGLFLFISSIFYFKIKRDSISIYSKQVVQFVAQKNFRIGKIKIETIVEFILVSVESLIMARVCLDATFINRPFGNLVGTGANYFGLLFTVWILIILASMLVISNPIKQLDIVTLFLPFYLTFVRLACFFNGCCWGIPWKYGLYNHNPHHPGNQVPVQAIEAAFVFAIYLFLLWYRKRAKTGTMFPMYMILYGGARFFNEFFTAAEPDIIGPFNMYHILCVISVVIGLIAFFILRKYGEKISDAFDRKVNNTVEKISRNKAERIAEENAKKEAEMQERLEKAKAARAKAKAAKKK